MTGAEALESARRAADSYTDLVAQWSSGQVEYDDEEVTARLEVALQAVVSFSTLAIAETLSTMGRKGVNLRG